jgi:SAM-dependent methyltransferase
MESEYSPSRFREEYTDFYRRVDSDSPVSSRMRMKQSLVAAVEGIYFQRGLDGSGRKVQILSLGAGRQKLEEELLSDGRLSDSMSGKADIITLDIAALHASQLFSTVPHVTADGSRLPFGDNQFDIVCSNMAIDFMPRTAFKEAARVLAPGGKFIANLHHPNLIEIARSRICDIRHAIRKYNQKLYFAPHSKDAPATRQKLVNAEDEHRDVEFILYNFPHLVFHSLEEISEYFKTHFHYSFITMKEYKGDAGFNGWFYVEVDGLQKKVNSEEYTI